VGKRKQGTKKIGFTTEDARSILLASRAQTKLKDAHKRWCPWLAAFNGARIDEIAGAMVTDVTTIDNVPCLQIRADSRRRNIKNDETERTIPIHSAVITEGFLEYVAMLPKDAPLFPQVKPDRFGSRGGNATKSIGRWIRKELKITNPRYSPNHSWRHRMESEHRAWGIREDITNAILGHHDGEASASYGEFYLKETLYPVIERMPSLCQAAVP
jgi:integrase